MPVQKKVTSDKFLKEAILFPEYQLPVHQSECCRDRNLKMMLILRTVNGLFITQIFFCNNSKI